MVIFSFQLEIAKRKEASCIVQYAKREQDVAELKVILIAYHMLPFKYFLGCLSHIINVAELNALELYL